MCHTHVCTHVVHSLPHTRCTYTHKEGKTSGSSCMKHSYSAQQTSTGMPDASLRNLSLVPENPPVAELVTHRRTVQVSLREAAQHKFHKDPLLSKKWAFAFQVNTKCPLMLHTRSSRMHTQTTHTHNTHTHYTHDMC